MAEASVAPGSLPPVQAKRLRSLRVALNAIIGLLFLQFLMGMWANLFASFPSPGPSPGQGFGVVSLIMSSRMSVLMVHAVTGLVILALSIAAVALTRGQKQKNLVLFGMLGLVSVLVAVYSGYYFVYSGYTSGVYSFVMAAGFICAIMCYFFDLQFTLIRMRKVRLLN